MVNAARQRTMHLDIVIPIFNEEETLPELGRRLEQTCAQLDDVDWRVVYVNDGSRDRSRELILEQRQRDPRFTLLDLSRNFGHQCAISAGLAHTDADAVVVMDGDLQDPPEVIPDLLACWRDNGEVVYAARRSRSEKGLRRLGLDAFHKLFYWLSDFPIPTQTGVFGLLDRQAVEEFNRFSERNRFIPGLRSWIGFQQRMVHYDRSDRAAGAPKQTLQRLVRYALDGVFSFSYKPLRLMTYAGLCISAVGFCLAGMYAVKRLLGIETAQTGFTTLVTLVLFLGGVQLIAVGLLGEYIGRVYDEVKQRPLYIVRGRHGLEIAGSAKEKPAKA
jgi:glycosyltransferase involved in cell wall biosynthesis